MCDLEWKYQAPPSVCDNGRFFTVKVNAHFVKFSQKKGAGGKTEKAAGGKAEKAGKKGDCD